MEALRAHCDGIVVLDTETSGLQFQGDEIIEFAVVRLQWQENDWVPVCEADEFIRREDDRKLDARIVELTGITDACLREEGISKQRFAALLNHLLTPRTLVVAYNAQFDLLFLYYFLEKYGDARLLRDLPKLDLLTVYRDRHDYPHKLCNAIDAYELSARVQNSHRAIDDVRATVEVMRAMWEERADLARYLDLFGYLPKYGVSGPKIRSVTYLPQGYRRSRPLYEEAVSAGV